jgi:lipopolysaccharide/colanic/teichoic acid biosynthesis glycosyltransferase
MYKKYFKRLLDIVLSLFGLIILSPVFIIVTVLLFFANKGKPFFFQERPGKGEKIFKVIKFKTMTDKCDAEGLLLPNKDRLTNVGRFIRAASLDELPQLINVLKGDISLIGPRPLLVDFLSLYNAEQRRRHDVKPGITGWAQVNGRNTMKYSEKFIYDVWYVNNLSFKLDIKILFTTIINVVKSKDVGNGLQHEVDDLGWAAKMEENRKKKIINNI